MSKTPRVRTRHLTAPEDFVREMKQLGVHLEGVKIMTAKSSRSVFLVEDLDPRGANILKQEMLAVGAEACVPYSALQLEGDEKVKVLVFGETHRIARAIDKLRLQPFGLPEVARQMVNILEIRSSPTREISWGRHRLVLDRTLVMGILNLTDDSFYDGGRYSDPQAAVRRARQMVEEGADIIDVGAESTRPGAEPLSAEDEMERLKPVLEALIGELDVPISLDTYKSRVAAFFLGKEKLMINDVTGLRDPALARVVETNDVPVIIMHMLGDPRTMQKDPTYVDVVGDIMAFFRDRLNAASITGIKPERIILDPGIGFGKTLEHNLEILRRLDEFRDLGHPLLVGHSRKSFLGHITGQEVDDRLEASLGAGVVAAANGAGILRVHDVAETRRSLAVLDAIRSGASKS